MKPNRSRDGIYRATIRIEYRVTSTDVIYAIARYLLDESLGSSYRALLETGNHVTKKIADESLRREIEAHGAYNLWTIVENYNGETGVAAAVSVFRRLYPEWEIEEDLFNLWLKHRS